MWADLVADAGEAVNKLAFDWRESSKGIAAVRENLPLVEIISLEIYVWDVPESFRFPKMKVTNLSVIFQQSFPLACLEDLYDGEGGPERLEVYVMSGIPTSGSIRKQSLRPSYIRFEGDLIQEVIEAVDPAGLIGVEISAYPTTEARSRIDIVSLLRNTRALKRLELMASYQYDSTPITEMETSFFDSVEVLSVDVGKESLVLDILQRPGNQLTDLTVRTGEETFLTDLAPLISDLHSFRVRQMESFPIPREMYNAIIRSGIRDLELPVSRTFYQAFKSNELKIVRLLLTAQIRDESFPPIADLYFKMVEMLGWKILSSLHAILN